MPRGPQEARLDRAVSGASRSAIQAAEEEWRNGARSLDSVAMALEMAGPQVIANFGGTHTGPAAQRAFQQVAAKVRARKEQMERAADALARADSAMGQAQQVHTSLGAVPSEPARPDIAPGTNDADAVRQQRVYSTQLGSYHAAIADREARAEAAANQMDRVYRDSTATMQQVHGEPDTRAGGSGAPGGSGGGVRTTGGSTSGGTSATATGTTGATHTGHPPSGASTTGGSHVVAPTGATPAVISASGTAQDGAVLPAVSSAPATVGAGGSVAATSSTGAGAAAGLAGALGGGLLGGAAGIGGAVRGGTAVPGSAGAASRAGGTIGSSARAAAAGTLGRGGASAASGSTAAAPRAGATSSAARAGAPGATASTGRPNGATTGNTGRATGGRTTGGRAAGGAGTRLGPRGAGIAVTRGGQGRDEDRQERDDLFESPQDWVDDEDAAPGVID